MTTNELSDFVDRGYLDHSVTEKYDPYYEPRWTGDDAWMNGTAHDELEAYNDARRYW